MRLMVGDEVCSPFCSTVEILLPLTHLLSANYEVQQGCLRVVAVVPVPVST